MGYPLAMPSRISRHRHPSSIYNPPTPLDLAIDQINASLESPSLLILSEEQGYWDQLRTTLENGRVIGPQIHDARIAALCQLHGVRELLSADRDFSRFPGLASRNPLIDQV